ncbi:type 4b pilus protein PilO2 [Salmonella enterica]|uniref:type 4b pilus protein PilO2 n=1 Tax=Salmonella enterica TaxID=28901 RepID=UPI0016037D06|nr:type 4b pilus protein PilO2 [Salmonella enterica]
MADYAIYRIGRLTAVAGLRWRVVSQHHIRALRVLARNEQASHLVRIRAGDSTLLGYAGLRDAGLHGRVCSLALIAARYLGTNGFAVFTLPDGDYWFIGMTDGQLSVISDITGSAEDMQNAVGEFLRFNTPEDGWFRYAPAGLLPELDTEEREIADVLPATLSVTSRVRTVWYSGLHPVSVQKRNTRLLLAGAAIAGGWLLWQHWLALQEEKQVEAEHSALLKEQQARQSARRNRLKPWQQLPAPVEFIRSCNQVWSTVPLSIAGWTFTHAECGRDSGGQPILMVRYSRPDRGNVGSFAARLPAYYHNVQPAFDIPGNASTGQFTLPVLLPSARTDDVLPAEQPALLMLTSYAQKIHADLSLKKVTGGKVPLPWVTWGFSLKTDIPPRSLVDSDLKTDGLRLSRISLSLQSARLHYELDGELYARR